MPMGKETSLHSARSAGEGQRQTRVTCVSCPGTPPGSCPPAFLPSTRLQPLPDHFQEPLPALTHTCPSFTPRILEVSLSPPLFHCLLGRMQKTEPAFTAMTSRACRNHWSHQRLNNEGDIFRLLPLGFALLVPSAEDEPHTSAGKHCFSSPGQKSSVLNSFHTNWGCRSYTHTREKGRHTEAHGAHSRITHHSLKAKTAQMAIS